LIEKGTIAKIGSKISESGVKTIAAHGKLVMPGLIDIHVHLRVPGRES
jgi:dihydroorotase